MPDVVTQIAVALDQSLSAPGRAARALDEVPEYVPGQGVVLELDAAPPGRPRPVLETRYNAWKLESVDEKLPFEPGRGASSAPEPSASLAQVRGGLLPRLAGIPFSLALDLRARTLFLVTVHADADDVEAALSSVAGWKFRRVTSQEYLTGPDAPVRAGAPRLSGNRWLKRQLAGAAGQEDYASWKGTGWDLEREMPSDVVQAESKAAQATGAKKSDAPGKTLAVAARPASGWASSKAGSETVPGADEQKTAGTLRQKNVAPEKSSPLGALSFVARELSQAFNAKWLAGDRAPAAVRVGTARVLERSEAPNVRAFGPDSEAAPIWPAPVPGEGARRERRFLYASSRGHFLGADFWRAFYGRDLRVVFSFYPSSLDELDAETAGYEHDAEQSWRLSESGDELRARPDASPPAVVARELMEMAGAAHAANDTVWRFSAAASGTPSIVSAFWRAFNALGRASPAPAPLADEFAFALPFADGEILPGVRAAGLWPDAGAFAPKKPESPSAVLAPVPPKSAAVPRKSRASGKTKKRTAKIAARKKSIVPRAPSEASAPGFANKNPAVALALDATERDRFEKLRARFGKERFSRRQAEIELLVSKPTAHRLVAKLKKLGKIRNVTETEYEFV